MSHASSRPGHVLPAFALLAAIACGSDGGPGGSGVGTTDSAGVTILTTSGAAWAASPYINVDTVPSIEIGVADGPDEYTLDRVRAVHRLADSGILVVEQATIRLYDDEGRYVRTIGRPGSGPGEFGFIIGAVPCGDRVVVSDLMRNRVTTVTLAGELVDEVMERSRSGPRTPTGCLDGASVVWTDASEDPVPDEHGLVRPAMLLVRFEDASSNGDTIMSVTTTENYDGLRRPFGRTTRVAIGSASIHTVDTGMAEVRAYSVDGRLERIYRFDLEGRPVTADDIRHIRDDYLQGVPESLARDEIIPRLDAVSMPDVQPVFDEFAVDADGNLWLQSFYAFKDRSSRRWAVVTPAGQWLGAVDLPESFEPHEFGHGDVLGIWTDELGVEHVRVHSIQLGTVDGGQ